MSPTNQRILCLLAVEPTYPRKIGNLLAISETEVARRLRRLQGFGVVESSWDHRGTNVKVYRLVANRLEFTIQPQGLEFTVRSAAGPRLQSFVVLPFAFSVPQPLAFVGRSDELGVLGGPEPVVVVEGIAGMGKTALLSRFVQSLPRERPLFWHSFRGLESLSWLASRFAVFFAQHGNPNLMAAIDQGEDLANRRQILLRSLDDERYVIVFDDVHRIEDPSVRQFLTDAINGLQRAKLVAAGREPPRFDAALPGRRVLRLGGLQDEDVKAYISQKHPGADATLLHKIHDEVGGHPLALALLLEAAAEDRVPLARLLDRIPERNIEDYLLEEVVASLPEDDRQVLTLASLFRDRFSAEDLAAVSKRLPEYVLPRLRHRLLIQPVGSEYVLHEVIRNFFYTLLQDKPALHAKAAAHYAGLGTIEGRLEAMHHFLIAGRRDRVLELVEENLSLQDFDFIDTGYQNLYDAVLAQFRREEVLNPRRWAIVLDERGDIKMVQGQPEAALAFYRDAAAHLGTKERELAAELARKQALALQRLGRADEARSLLGPVVGRGGRGGPRWARLSRLARELGLPQPERITASPSAAAVPPKKRGARPRQVVGR